jgi:glycosyltransferase involved in cell wall biosynthesis
MRVGFVVYGSLETATGGYLYDRQLVDYLRANGDTVEVVSLPDRGYVRNLVSRHGVDIACDVIVEDELCHPTLAFAERPASGTPVVAVAHLLRADGHRRSPWHPLYAAVERRYLTGVDAAVFNSEATRTSAERLVGRAMRGVVARPAADHLDVAAVSGIPSGPGPLRVLCVANVLPGKGVVTLVDALAQFPGGTCVLTIVGSVTADPAYVRRVRERIQRAGLQGAVELVGEVPNSAVPGHLVSHHALAVPSSFEAAGIAYLEAMRMGRPVIATAAGGAPELLDDGVEGFLVPPDDVEALHDRLRRWAGDRALVARMGEAARRRAESHPTWSESLGPVRELLKSLATVTREKAQ